MCRVSRGGDGGLNSFWYFPEPQARGLACEGCPNTPLVRESGFVAGSPWECRLQETRTPPHLYATAISDHFQRLHSREVVRQPEVDVIPVHEPVSPEEEEEERIKKKTPRQENATMNEPAYSSDVERKGKASSAHADTLGKGVVLKTLPVRHNCAQKPLFLRHLRSGFYPVQAFEFRILKTNTACSSQWVAAGMEIKTALYPRLPSLPLEQSGRGGALHTHTFIADGAESSPPPVTLIALIFTTWGAERTEKKKQNARSVKDFSYGT